MACSIIASYVPLSFIIRTYGYTFTALLQMVRSNCAGFPPFFSLPPSMPSFS